jgi:hypothetical protein
MSRLSLLFLLCILFVSATAIAQPSDPKKIAETAKAKTENDPEAERMIRERRANAQSLLISLAADAVSYNDLKLRARTLARIADALWDADPERARSMFRKAWDAAEVVDQEGQRKLQEEIKEQEKKGGSVAVSGPPNIRGEVLRLAARRDRKLGEELLAKLTTAKQQEATEATDKARSNLLDTPEAITQRLSLARQLLEADVERALQFADPALATITREGIDFLSYLRAKDAAAADRRYAAMLGLAAGNLQSDANTVSLLSSYLFTPHIFVTFNGGGASTTQSSRSTGPAEAAADLRSGFFRVASEILLRPLPPPGQDQTSAGVVGKYLMLKRLMPLFEQYASPESVQAVRAHMDALANAVSEEARQRDDDSLREGIRPPEKSEDREKVLRDQLERAKTAEDRDRLNLQLARLYSEKDDVQEVREFVEKIEDTELRKNARAFFDAILTLRAVDNKNADRVVELVRTGELTHLQKAWALAQAAKLLLKSDREKALTLLDEATASARRIDGADPDRPRALMALANVMFIADREKSWDAVYDAIKAANSAEGFTGEDGILRISLRTKSMASTRTSSAPDFNVAGIFTELARDDYGRTVELARGFQREAPRASATIAIARAVLEEKKKS